MPGKRLIEMVDELLASLEEGTMATRRMSKAWAAEIIARHALVSYPELDAHAAVGYAIGECRALPNNSDAYHAADILWTECDTQRRTPGFHRAIRLVRQGRGEFARRDAAIASMERLLARWA